MRVPTKLATPMLANAIDNSKITVAVVRLNKTSVSMNFQNVSIVGTNPINPYTIPPNARGGTIRKGRMSKRIWNSNELKDRNNRYQVSTFEEK